MGFRRLLVVLSAVCVVAVVDAAFVYRDIPTGNTGLSHFDTLIVLGTPANPDGSASPEQRERTLEGVREYKAEVAPHLIMTGGAAHNQFVEARVMKELAIAQGVPADAITEEGQAQNTIQNIYYSEKIMTAQHWTSAEVVSSPSHLPRAALILAHYSFFWRTHPAPWPPEYSALKKGLWYCVEAVYCLRLRVLGFPVTSYLPRHG
jgi:vancomycin permeability regulator SanA